MAYGNPYRYESYSGYVPDGNAPRIETDESEPTRDRGYGVSRPAGKQTVAGAGPVSSYPNADGSTTYTYGAQPQAKTLPPPAQAQAPTVGLDPSNGQIGSYISRLLSNPDPYGEELFQRAYAQGIRGIDDSYNQQKTGIDEEMARRGLTDSTIAGGRLHDLNIGRRSASVELQDRLAQNRARDYMGNALSVGNLGLGWGSQGLNAYNAQNNFLIALLSALGAGDFIGG